MTEDPEEYRRLRTRLGGRGNVKVALGLHPLRAATFTQNDFARFFRLLPDAHWLGEVGLDFSRAGIASKRQQLKAFDVILSEAQPGQHPMSVHSRGAETEVIRLLSQSGLPAVLHWYTGPIGLIDEALAAGLYFSINAAMTRSKKFPSLVRAVPIERVPCWKPTDRTRRRPEGQRGHATSLMLPETSGTHGGLLPRQLSRTSSTISAASSCVSEPCRWRYPPGRTPRRSVTNPARDSIRWQKLATYSQPRSRAAPLDSKKQRGISPLKPEEIHDLPSQSVAADLIQRSQVQILPPLQRKSRSATG